MLIFKSFFRKKTTKVYFVVYALIILGLILLVFTRNVLINKENESYKGSFLEIKNFDESKLKSKKNIDNITKALSIQNKMTVSYILIPDDSLKRNETIISSKFKEQVKLNDEIEIENEINNEIITLNISGFSEEIYNEYIMYISSELFNKYNNSDSERYIITFKSWLNYDDEISEFRKIFSAENVFPHYYKGNGEYRDYITVVNVLLIVLIILFAIVLIVTNFNIIQDENKKNIIYYRIGYNKYVLKLYNVSKIILLILSSTIFSGIVFYLIYFIYKLCF